jgi:hypothetical protein
MSTLTYWYCECLDDADAYSIVTKTKKEAITTRISYGVGRWAPPVKKTLNYRDAFDLFEWATGEGGGRGCGTTA